MIISPCISICKTDPVSGYCYGCGRSNDDKKMWKNEETKDEWKKNNLLELEKRLNGWQLKSFKESYNLIILLILLIRYLVKTFIDLFKLFSTVIWADFGNSGFISFPMIFL